MKAFSFNSDSFCSTQGQWWYDRSCPGIERRTALMAAHMGHHLYTTELRCAESRQVMASKYWASTHFDSKPVAIFDSPEERREWLERQWEANAA